MNGDSQNPLYPQDADLTVPEMEAMARACSMERAQSPGELVCIIDDTSSDDVPVIVHDLVHSYQELMDYRYENVIADDAPWTYWTLFDVWAALQPAQLPPSPGPPPPNGWQWQARVNPAGISETDGSWSDYINSTLTYVTRIDPSVVLLAQPGLETRLLLTAGPPWWSGANVSDVFIGPISSADPWIASELLHLTFDGGNNASSFFLDKFTDPIPVGIDASNGLLVSLCVNLGVISGRQVEPGWSVRLQAGNHSADLDKSSTAWTPGNWASVGLLTVDGYYVAATSTMRALDAGDYLLGAGVGASGLAFSGKHSHGQQPQPRAGARPGAAGRRAVRGAAGRAPLWRPGRNPRRG